MDALLPSLREILRRARGAAPPLRDVLALAIREAGAQGGTIHVLEADGATLRLAAWSDGIPQPVLDAVRTVPVGKGMAGVAAERRAPVFTCDLQTDNAGGVARPGAKATGLRGSVCVPMLASDGRLAGSFGIGAAEAREFSPAELETLLAAATLVADAVLAARPTGKDGD